MKFVVYSITIERNI